MKQLLKKMVLKALRYSGLPLLFRELIQRNKLTILCLHDMPPEVAEPAFEYLNRKYNIIGLNDYLRAKQNGAGKLPPKALVVSFDDGHAGNHALLPILEKTKIPVTIFLCSGIVDTNRHFWFNFKHPDIQKEKLKRVSNRERLRLLAEAGFFPEQEYAAPQALNRRQIQNLVPLVNFQAHTQLHPCLPQCADDEAQTEIAGCKQSLEQQFNLNINALAYPNGDYSDRDIALTKAAGYRLGLTVDYGFNTLKTDPYRLKRLSIGDHDTEDQIALKACGLWGFVKTWNGTRQQHGWHG